MWPSLLFICWGGVLFTILISWNRSHHSPASEVFCPPLLGRRAQIQSHCYTVYRGTLPVFTSCPKGKNDNNIEISMNYWIWWLWGYLTSKQIICIFKWKLKLLIKKMSVICKNFTLPTNKANFDQTWYKIYLRKG